ncbi:hypothetical protein SAMN04488570_0276 [Nocardioides scoriae]|uniref:Uncharacterized protein n=2 Tax=Nocardioides scoriae TaxID=642780 RepID=A0A1H1LMC0_9ACTN|nr:hypothetical protein SAMN04488570_0276 [Nocardioides scoriae]
MKSRVAPYTWAKGDLLKILRRWADLTASKSAAFEFLTDGELAASGHVVVAALDAARGGDLRLIAGLLGVPDTDPMCKVAARVHVVSEPGSVEALLLSAEIEVRALLSIGTRHPDAEKESIDRVNELFRLISTRSGMSDADDRIVSREEIVAVLGGASDLPAADRWASALGGEYQAAAAALDVSDEVTPALRAGWQSEELRIEDLDRTSTPLVLAGRTGSGKSTVARLWRHNAAVAGRSVVVCHVEAYIANRLDRLVADAVGDLVGRNLPRAVGRQTLADPSTTLVLDGVSEVPPHLRGVLAEELRTHLAGGHNARVVVVGRDETLCASVYPTSVAAGRLFPHAFGREQRTELTAKVLSRIAETEPTPGPDSAGGPVQPYKHSEPGGPGDVPADEFARESATALARVEHALGDAAGNPMLLRLALELVADGVPFTDRASVYGGSVERMAARTNAGDVRIASAMLGVVFARLLDQGKRYANPLEWERLFSEAAALLQNDGIATEVAHIREAVARSGLINAIVTGIGSTTLKGPVHDSFADYFAARAHADGLVHLPVTLVENDENRVLLSAQMLMFSDADVLAVAERLPFTLVRLSESDHNTITDDTPEFVARILSAVLPDLAAAGVTMWRRQDGTPLAQVGAGISGWVGIEDAPDLFAGTTVVTEPGDGPVAVATRLWQWILHHRLGRSSSLRPRTPRSRQEACDQLTAHTDLVVAAAKLILAEVAPRVAAERLAQTVGPLGITGVVYEREGRELGPDGWPVRFRHSPATHLVPAPDNSPATDRTHGEDRFTTWGDVESHVSTSPEREAAKKIRSAIVKLTRNHWL